VGDLYLWLAAAALVAGTWLAALKLSLISASRSVTAKALEARGLVKAARWLEGAFDRSAFAVSLLRTITRLGFFALVLAEIVQLDAEAKLTWSDLLVAGLVSVPLLWVFTTVLAAALARHAPAGIIRSGLPLLRVSTVLLYPLTRATAFIDEMVRRLTGANLRDEDESEAELLRSIDQTHREGKLDEEAAEMLENVVEFASTDVAEIMTPRTDIHGIELTNDLAEIRAFIAEHGHSRIPVYRESLDQIVGVLYVRDLVQYLGEGADGFELEPLLRQPIFVPETKPVRDLLAEFQRGEVHLAIVIDEYGGTEGLVTMEDVLEEIVGEIRDEHQPEGDEEPSLVSIGERLAEADGRFHIDDLNAELGLSLPEDDDFDTIGGFMMARLGHVPEEGEVVETPAARFTAIAAAPTHVQKVRIEIAEGGGVNGDGK